MSSSNGDGPVQGLKKRKLHILEELTKLEEIETQLLQGQLSTLEAGGRMGFSRRMLDLWVTVTIMTLESQVRRLRKEVAALRAKEDYIIVPHLMYEYLLEQHKKAYEGGDTE